jgi:nucleoside-diphosphate-sugar epimerase
VIIIDNFITGKIENLRSIKNIKVIKGSVTNLNLLKSVFKGVDYVFHQAALPSVARSIANPKLIHRMNLDGTLNVLLAAKSRGVRKVIYASTSAIYGDTPELPKCETMSPVPQSPYAVTKLASEYYCKVFYEVYRLSTVSLRYFNVYGPRQDTEGEYAAVIPIFINRVSANQPPIIFGDGTQTRDFIFVDDVVDGTIASAETDDVDGEVLNIATGRSTSIRALAELIIKLAGKKLGLEYAEARPGDIKHSVADISKAKKLLGWKPKYTLSSGLKKLVKKSLFSLPR